MGLACAAVYALLAVAFYARAPRLFAELDQAFDADLGSWTIDLARPQGPHQRTQVHPISVLLLNPLGTTLKEPLRAAGVELAARLAASLLCAAAGGATVAAFLVLLGRLGVRLPRARVWALLFATSATQLVFSSLPESYAFSACSLVLVFAVAAGRAPSAAARILAGVLSFGITATNLVAVGVASAFAPDEPWAPRLRRAAGVCGAVLLATAALALLQRALYPSAQLFFVPNPVRSGYTESLYFPADVVTLADRGAAVASHLLFAGLAAPRLHVEASAEGRVVVDFAPLALREPTLLSLVHWVLWTLVLLRASLGLLRGATPAVTGALLAWLGFQAALHLVFGTSLFLYSGHWVFAVVALAAAGCESRPDGGHRMLAPALALLLPLQIIANGSLLLRILRLFAER